MQSWSVPFLVWVPAVVALLVACDEPDARTQTTTDDSDDRTDGTSDDGTDAGLGLDGGVSGEGEGEGEDDPDGGRASLGDPVSGELFHFIVERDCDHRWALDGLVVDCLECELAFDVDLVVSGESSCGDTVPGFGRVKVTETAVYFEGTYQGAVFEMEGGYLTWNSVGYVYGDQTYYYLGRVDY